MQHTKIIIIKETINIEKRGVSLKKKENIVLIRTIVKTNARIYFKSKIINCSKDNRVILLHNDAILIILQSVNYNY